MIYYYTALVLVYSMSNGMETTSYIWYDRERHCQEALQSLIDPIYSQIYDLYDDTMATCHVSDEVSFVLKPKLREEK